jgi:site-specific recombinase XerD
VDTQAIVPVAERGRAQLPQLVEAARDYAAAGMADGTRRTYGSAWRSFTSWCASVGREPLPAEAATLALYLTARAPILAASTLARHLAAIAAAHAAAGLPPPAHPDLARVWAGIKRTHGRPARKKRALVVEDLRRVIAKLPATNAGIRDRALLLVGFAGALRRSELAALTLPGPCEGNVRAVFVAGGLEIHLDRAKGDQAGKGAIVAIPYGRKLCAVAALQAWLTAAQIVAGPVFRAIDRHGRIAAEAISGKTVANVVKAAAERVGLDPAALAGHSLRSGLLTSAAEKGAAPEVLQAHARHSKFDTTAGYIQSVDRFRRNAAGKVGL